MHAPDNLGAVLLEKTPQVRSPKANWSPVRGQTKSDQKISVNLCFGKRETSSEVGKARPPPAARPWTAACRQVPCGLACINWTWHSSTPVNNKGIMPCGSTPSKVRCRSLLHCQVVDGLRRRPQPADLWLWHSSCKIWDMEQYQLHITGFTSMCRVALGDRCPVVIMIVASSCHWGKD